MKIFHRDHCGHLLFFENTQCVCCGRSVAYLSDLRLVGSLESEGGDVLNNLNHGLGHADAYPFVLSPIAIAKLKFVDDVVGRARVGGPVKVGDVREEV